LNRIGGFDEAGLRPGYQETQVTSKCRLITEITAWQGDLPLKEGKYSPALAGVSGLLCSGRGADWAARRWRQEPVVMKRRIPAVSGCSGAG
jgi:hypothetical protein